MGKTFLMSPPVFYFIFPLKFQTKQGFLHLSIPETQFLSLKTKTPGNST